MKKFAGTFHQNKQGDWVKCITEGGKPCSRHASGEHIKGTNLEEALETLHEDDDFGLEDSLPSVVEHAYNKPESSTVESSVKEEKQPAKKPKKKTLHKEKSQKKPAISKNTGMNSISSLKVDPKKHQEMLDELIEEDSARQPGTTHHMGKKGMLEYKTSGVREKHYQNLMRAVDMNKPSGIKSSALYHMDKNATIESVSHEIFPDVQETSSIKAHLEQQSAETWEKMTKDERKAIHSYTGNHYSSMNSRLMNGTSSDFVDMEELDKSINDMEEGLKKSVTDEDMLVYRCRFMNKHDGRSLEETAYYDAVSHGDGSLTRANFCSTTLSPSAETIGYEGFDNAYVIKVPKGTHGFYVNERSYHESEDEFILDKGLKYKVVGIYERSELQTNEYGVQKWFKAPIIALEIVPDNVSEEEQS
jgi:G:T/U-mismatch repair DNA glycosylase